MDGESDQGNHPPTRARATEAGRAPKGKTVGIPPRGTHQKTATELPDSPQTVNITVRWSFPPHHPLEPALKATFTPISRIQRKEVSNFFRIFSDSGQESVGKREGGGEGRDHAPGTTRRRCTGARCGKSSGQAVAAALDAAASTTRILRAAIVALNTFETLGARERAADIVATAVGRIGAGVASARDTRSLGAAVAVSRAAAAQGLAPGALHGGATYEGRNRRFLLPEIDRITDRIGACHGGLDAASRRGRRGRRGGFTRQRRDREGEQASGHQKDGNRRSFHRFSMSRGLHPSPEQESVDNGDAGPPSLTTAARGRARTK